MRFTCRPIDSRDLERQRVIDEYEAKKTLLQAVRRERDALNTEEADLLDELERMRNEHDELESD